MQINQKHLLFNRMSFIRKKKKKETDNRKDFEIQYGARYEGTRMKGRIGTNGYWGATEENNTLHHLLFYPQ